MVIESKKQMNTYLIIILVFITLSIVFYSYYRTHNKVLARNFEVKFESSDIVEINNKLPLSTAIGKTAKSSDMEKGILGTSSFSITNPNDFRVKYEIYITKQYSDKESIPGKYVNFYLENEDGQAFEGYDKNVLPSYDSLNEVSDRPTSRLIYSGKIDALTTIDFNLKSWVSDAYALNEEEQIFSYDIDVRMK